MSELLGSIVEALRGVLLKVAAHAPTAFSGVAVVLYDSQFSHCCHCDLRDASAMLHVGSHSVTIGDDFVDLLLTISPETHSCHDGFVLVNERGIVTHIAQYFVPPIVPGLTPHNDHGTRFYSALCGSLVPGVTAVGVVCANRDCFVVESGCVVFEQIGDAERRVANRESTGALVSTYADDSKGRM